MSVSIETPVAHEVEYPDSDGQPIADNTKQFRWIVTIQGGIDALFLGDPNVFVAGDLLWYPVEGNNRLRAAPDIMVVFGRPKGDRGSYRQWLEDNIAPQVVFEVLSPGNTPIEMLNKHDFYERYGVEEFYLFDPDNCELAGWLRQNGHLEPIASMEGWVSPRLGIRFELAEGDLQIYRPDRQRFLTFVELNELNDKQRQELLEAQSRAAEAERVAALEKLRVDQAERQLTELSARLQAGGIDPGKLAPEGKGT